MRRYRNARYAPESLERKLSPSAVGIAPAPVTADPTVVAAVGNADTTPVVVIDDTDELDLTAYTVDYSSDFAADSDGLALDDPASDYLLADNDAPPIPGDGLPPIDTSPIITGPALPA